MLYQDLDDVTNIEAHCSPAPWTYKIFESCLTSSYLCVVAVTGDEVRGFGVLNIGLDEGHIMNLGVVPAHRSQGIGRQLLEHLLGFCRRSEAESVFLEVRATNQTAIDLYESLGFQIIGRRTNYYAREKDEREDAINMVLQL